MTPTSSTAHAAERVIRPSEQELIDAWRQLVEENAEQKRRLAEFGMPEDYWAEGFAASVVNMDALAGSSAHVASLADAGESWLDIGAGYGRVTLPLSRHVGRITAVDPSPGLTERIRASVADLGISNIDVLEPDSWPPTNSPGIHDACLAINIINFVAEIGLFLDAMEQHARRLCVVVATELGTAWQPVEPVFEILHGEQYIRQPALREFLALLGARRRRFDIATYDDMLEPEALDIAHSRVRSYFLVREGSQKDARLRQLLTEHFGVGDDRVRMPPPMGTFVAVISWTPPQTS